MTSRRDSALKPEASKNTVADTAELTSADSAIPNTTRRSGTFRTATRK